MTLRSRLTNMLGPVRALDRRLSRPFFEMEIGPLEFLLSVPGVWHGVGSSLPCRVISAVLLEVPVPLVLPAYHF